MTAAEILLIEDDPNDVELTTRALRRHNLAGRLAVVHDGPQALNYMFGSDPDTNRQTMESLKIVLMDLKLPKMDGIEVLRRFKEDDCCRRVPVVMLTSSYEERDIVRAYSLGVNSYIVKPVEFERYGATVAEVGLYWFLRNRPPYEA